MATHHPHDPLRCHPSAPGMHPIRSLAPLQPHNDPSQPWCSSGESNYNPSQHNQMVASAVPLHARQLRPLRNPCYTPVALRVTQYPSQRLWLTRRRASNASNGSEDAAADVGSLSPTNKSFAGPNARQNKLEVGTMFDDEWMFGSNMSHRVEGPPTREHWKPDSHATICDAPKCTTAFSFFERRHHCRKCGLIFCSPHSPHTIPLDELARFHTEGVRSRACDECWEDYRAWETLRCSRNNSYSDASSPQNSPPTPGGIAIGRGGGVGGGGMMLGTGVAKGHGNPLSPGQTQQPGMGESIGGSVPRNWEWSTF